MRILIINSVCGIRSTGRICTDFAEEYIAEGHEVKIAYGRENPPEKYQNLSYRIGSEMNVKFNALSARLFDNEGFVAKKQTADFLKWAEEYNPELLWLHNLHGYYINIEMLFGWIKSRPQMQVKWLLHDCWAFTGHCSYFTAIKCEQWKTFCSRCFQKRSYPKSIIVSNCRQNYGRKKRAFSNVKNMILVTPSQWLADLVKQSFLRDYRVEVRHNTIDTTVFRPTPSDFRTRYGLNNKKIVLGVASVWDERKGLNDFIELSKLLDETYAVVLVGLSEKQIKKVPDNIVSIARTNSKKELAEIYTAADVFLNLTYEDNYPTVNLEAQACGTPCITYKTGGSPESVPTKNVVEVGDISKVLQCMKNVMFEKSLYPQKTDD